MAATSTLIEILSGSISYDSSWAIYAEKIDGKFTDESPARFGQRVFENGGVLDDCELFAVNETACDSREEYTEGDEEFNAEWAGQFIEEVNEAQ